MNRLIKLFILIILSLSVYFIYNYTNNSKIKILIIGDYLTDKLNKNKYLSKYESNHKNYIINKNYIKKDLTINELLLLVKNTSLKKELLESHILLLNIGYNDYLFKSLLKKNNIINNNPLEEEQIELEELLKEIRKYYKNTIYIIGYPNFNNNYLLTNKVNTILKEKDITYIDTYNLTKNENEENNIYRLIIKEIEKTLEK